MKRRDHGESSLRKTLTSDHPLARNLFVWMPILLGLGVWWASRYWRPALLALAVILPILALALVDLMQERHSLRRNFPFAARFRWLFEDLRPFLRSYIVEGDLEGRPFNHDQRSLVYARAKADPDVQPFGTELDVYSGEYEWLSHSMAPTQDVPRDMRVEVGTEQCGKPYSAALLNISAMSFGSLGAKAIEALNRGARLGGFYHDTGEGGLSPYHLQGGDLVWEIGSGYFGARTAAGHFDLDRFADKAQDDRVRMTEIKLSQGAKPGHGGVLPAPKVTREIAEIRGVEAGCDVISPPAHSAFSTPIQLVELAARMREASGGKPVGIKLCVGYPHEVLAVCKAMLETGILLDFIVVDGGEGGTGAAPQELSDRVGMPLREGLVIVRNALVGCGLKDRVKLAASGKVYSGAAIAINAALGADWCNAARAFMFALGCVQSQLCHTDRCPTGVATQSPARQRGLVVPTKAERVHQFQQKTIEAFRDIMIAAGVTSPGDLHPSHLHQRVSVAEMKAVDETYAFLEPGALLADPESTGYVKWWKQARAESFRPRND